MSTTPHSWMPSSGRHRVDIGSSLGRALKARKGIAPKAKLDRDFFSFRYNFKPESVDSTKPGTIEVRKGKDNTSVTVERASTQTGEGGHAFLGAELPAKEWECVLIYDEETGMFTLEKLESYVSLTYDHKSTRAPRHPGSPLPPSNVTASTNPTAASPSKPRSKLSPQDELDLTAELERELGPDEDAEGDLDDEFAELLPVPISPVTAPSKREPVASSSTLKGKGKVGKPQEGRNTNMQTQQPMAQGKARQELPSKMSSLRQEEEESEGEIVEDRPLQTNAPVPVPSTQVRNQLPSQRPHAPSASKPPMKAPPPSSSAQVHSQISPPASASTVPPKTKARPVASAASRTKAASTTAGNKRAYEEEILDIVRPPPVAPPAKRARATPPREEESAFSLALPSSSHALSLPGSSNSMPTLAAPPTSFPGASENAMSALAQSDSEEEEWDEVQPPPRAITMEEIVPEALPRPVEFDEDSENDNDEEEIDMNAFEAEMNQHLGEAPADEDFLEAAVSPVAGDDIWGDEEDYSSSDDSDED